MRQYKSIILTLLVAFFFGLNANAQGSERAVATKIGDALNMLPADTQKKFNKLMGDIAETGAEGINMLLTMLIPSAPVSAMSHMWHTFQTPNSTLTNVRL